MKVKELMELLELFDEEQNVLYADDGLNCMPVNKVAEIRKAWKDERGIHEDTFIAISR